MWSLDGPHAVHPIQCLVYLFEDKEICASDVLFVEVLDAMELDSPTHTTHKLKLPNMVIPLQYPRYPRYPHKGYRYVGGNNIHTLTPTPHTLQQKPGGFQNPCHSLVFVRVCKGLNDMPVLEALRCHLKIIVHGNGLETQLLIQKSRDWSKLREGRTTYPARWS